MRLVEFDFRQGAFFLTKRAFFHIKTTNKNSLLKFILNLLQKFI